ncbi:MAG: branched-chain amino acid ABC transporter permease [Streptosporangiales bacterium]|nr:branched-chain amino acid ABC transporter permease [Streptosporangiales bacterium]
MIGWLAFAAFFLTNVGIYGILALGLNAQYGLAGLANFGYVALFAAGAFTAALVLVPPSPAASPETATAVAGGLGLPFPVALAGAAAVGGLFALVMGAVSLRLGGHSLAIVTFAFAQIFGAFLAGEDWLTGGQFGISPVPQPLRGLVGSAVDYLFLYLGVTLVIVAGCFWLAERAAGSPFGRVLRGIREDETAARSLGKNTGSFKLSAFVLGGVLAGLAGAMWVGSIGSVHVGQFVPIVTFNVWLAVLLGGIGNNRGVLLGAFLLICIREGTRFLEGIPFLAAASAGNPSLLPSLRYVIIGLALILVVRFAPRGVIPERLRGRGQAAPPEQIPATEERR